MFALVPALSLVAALPVTYAATAFTFAPPASGPLKTSANYTGQSNNTLATQPVVKGKVFDRFIQIWLENTDFDVAASTNTFSRLAKEGILLSQYYALTHPSEPNYVASVGGDFFGLHSDDLVNIPANVSTVVDLLEAKNISWASYQESMPTDGYPGFNFTSVNYLNASAPDYTFYVRKHNPTIIYDSVASVPSRVARHRNFNDFVKDVNASALPQWMFVTPNIVNDGHDTTIDFAANWLEFWLEPLLNDKRFNDNKTLILLTFDETETYTENNRVYSLLLGNAIPAKLKGTTDSTYYTHYSSLSTVQANWGLGSLGRGDTNKTMSNVFELIANVTGYKNMNVTDIPLTNITGPIPGPLNIDAWFPFTAQNVSAIGAGGGPVFVGPNVNTSFTTAPAPVNLTALNAPLPASGEFNATSTPPSPGSNSSSSSSSSAGSKTNKSGASSVYAPVASVLGVLVAATFVLV